MEIFWTPTAKETYLYVMDYLEEVWGKKYLLKFIKETEKLLKLIAKYPSLYELIPSQTDIRKAVLHKNCSFLYRVKDNAN